MYIIAVIQVKAFFSAKPITQATQLDGKRSLMADEWIGRLLTRSLGPQLEVIRVQTPHLQML